MLEVEQMIRFLEISLKLLEYYLLFSTSMDQTFSIEFGGNFTKYVATKKKSSDGCVPFSHETEITHEKPTLKVCMIDGFI